ncbi:MAG TPA: pyridoxal-phosphate dependent enzyme [Ktedonobacteraceae bacterium]|jgi:threonine dehydratase|nr:pyridoxal-phosphate dependent enzyme [Ktedonobacteraceae bacterium]
MVKMFPSKFYQHVVVTPFTRYQGPLAPQSELWLKDETQQVGHSFKFRGTYHRLSEEKPGTTVVTASTGNHGIGVSLAAQKLDLNVQIFVPEHISDVKYQKLVDLGASVRKVEGGYDECVQEALHFEAETGAPYISSLDDPSVTRGHSSLFYEIREQSEDQLDVLFLPVGGGGLLSGCLDAYHGTDMAIIGVELDCVPSMQIALATGERVLLPPARSLAEGMLVRQAGVVPLKKAREYAHFSIELVSEAEIEQAISLLLSHNGIRAEGAGASAVAVALRYLKRVPGQRVAAVISGGNIDENVLQEVLARQLATS